MKTMKTLIMATMAILLISIAIASRLENRKIKWKIPVNKTHGQILEDKYECLSNGSQLIYAYASSWVKPSSFPRNCFIRVPIACILFLNLLKSIFSFIYERILLMLLFCLKKLQLKKLQLKLEKYLNVWKKKVMVERRN